MKTNSNFLSKCILATYGVVLRCYPSTYREQFGELMLQAVKDELRHSRQQTANRIAFTLIKDISLSLPREHYAFESQQGFARKSFLLLLVLMTGLFVAREPLQQITTSSIEAIAQILPTVQSLRVDKYIEHEHATANAMLRSQDRRNIVAGAFVLIDMDWLHELSSSDRKRIRVELTRAISASGNDPAVLFNAMRICGNEPDICDAQPLLAKMRSLYPQNAMTWLRHAAIAKQQGNTNQQLVYLEQALNAPTYRHYGEIINLKRIEQMQKSPFELPWYLRPFGSTSQYSPKNLATYLAANTYVPTIPSCEGDGSIKISEVEIACQKIADKLLRNQSLDFGQRYFAFRLANKSGDTHWQGLAEADYAIYKALNNLPPEPKLPSLQETHDALAQGKVDALVKRIIAKNKQGKRPDLDAVQHCAASGLPLACW